MSALPLVAGRSTYFPGMVVLRVCGWWGKKQKITTTRPTTSYKMAERYQTSFKIIFGPTKTKIQKKHAKKLCSETALFELLFFFEPTS